MAYGDFEFWLAMVMAGRRGGDFASEILSAVEHWMGAGSG
jgi:hypothetical protein